MIIVDYTLDHPILAYTRTTLPEIEISVEDAYTSVDGDRQFIARIDYDDYDAVDAALDADSSVENLEVLHTAPDHRLYRLELVGRGAEMDIMPLLIEVGGVQIDLVATNEGWRNRTRFPDHEAFKRIHQFCVDHDIGFTIHRIWRETNQEADLLWRLTDAQYEALVAAVNCGYFEIPRRCSLADLATELEISESAASERLRRGVNKVITQTVDM